MSERNTAAWLQAWDSHGAHRTGTAEDAAGATWLAHEAAALGAKVSIETWTLNRIDPVACWLETTDGRIPGVPVFDSPSTGPDGIPGPIAVVSLSPWAVYTAEYREMRRETGGSGLAIVCQGAEPGLGLLNAEQFREPYGCPAIHIATAPVPGPMRLVSHYRRVASVATNIVI